MLNTLQKYILREWFWTLMAVLVVLLVFIMGFFLSEGLGDIADGRMPAGLLGKQMLLRIPEALNFILPLAGFVAILLGLGRLYRDQEMAVMRASGFSWSRLLRPLTVLMLPAALVAAWVGLWVAPKAVATADRMLEEASRSAELWGLQPGRFHVLQNGRLIVYVGEIGEDGHTLKDIFIHTKTDEREQIGTAASGQYWVDQSNGARYLNMQDGQITDEALQAGEFTRVHYSQSQIRLPEPEAWEQRSGFTAKSTVELLEQNEPAHLAEVHWRISPALALLVLSLLAIPLAHGGPREGRGGRILLGILVYAVYANLLQLGKAWMSSGQISSALGLWWVHGLVLLLVFVWLWRQRRLHT